MAKSFPTCPVHNNHSGGCPFEQTGRLTGKVGVLGCRHEADCRGSSSGLHYGTLLLQYDCITILANARSIDAMNHAKVWWQMTFSKSISDGGLIARRYTILRIPFRRTWNTVKCLSNIKNVTLANEDKESVSAERSMVLLNLPCCGLAACSRCI